jgi:hypothetical protein
LDVEDSGETDGVNWAIRVLHSIAIAEKTQLSLEKLIDGLNRVFPFDTNHEKLARASVDRILTFGKCQSRNDDFISALEEQLQIYRTAPIGEDGNRQRQEAAKVISMILQLDQDINDEIPGHISRLTRSRHIARGRKSRGAVGGEPICLVRCPGCLVINPFRLDLRETAGVNNKVFRIPGLSYSDGMENSIGLVINNGRITGRMCYGPPACNCSISELVEIR